MNYAKIDKNDITNGEGVCVSLWVQGCTIHCPGCHNSEIWDFCGGQAFTEDTMEEVLAALSANNLQRNLSILGGEPLAPQNITDLADIVEQIRFKYPDIKIYLWTGYTRDYLVEKMNPMVSYGHALEVILENIDYLIDGPYLAAERDITLKLRGSRNQHIWKKENNKWILEE